MDGRMCHGMALLVARFEAELVVLRGLLLSFFTMKSVFRFHCTNSSFTLQYSRVEISELDQSWMKPR